MPTGCCVVPLCSGRGGYYFPTDKKIKAKWIQAIRRDKWVPTKWSTVCKDHFVKEDFSDGVSSKFIFEY